MCPKCNKYSLCGCGSCNGRMSKTRTQKMKGETIKCPYCRTTFSIDSWELYSYSKLTIA